GCQNYRKNFKRRFQTAKNLSRNSSKMKRKKIFIALSTFGEITKEPIKILEKSRLDFSLNNLSRRLVAEEIIQMAGDCNGIIAGVEPYDDRVLENLKNLQCISRCGVGIDNISIKKAKEKK